MGFKLADGSLSTDYKVGDLFITNYPDYKNNSPMFTEGSVVKLHYNDGTDSPAFQLIKGATGGLNFPCGNGIGCHEEWCYLLPYSNLIEITQAEYDSLIDEINMLRECVADMNKLLEEKLKENTAPTFKPISEMTMEDWKQAKEEGWKFETEGQGVAAVVSVFEDCLSLEVPRLSYNWYVDGEGFDEDNEGWTIVKRIQ